MTKLTRVALLVVSASLSAGLGWFFYSPFVLVWDAPLGAVVVMAGAAWLLWFLVLLPLWLPALVPNSAPRLLRISHLLCGALLLLPLVLFIALLLLGEVAKTLGVAASIAVLFGAWHLTRRSSGPPSASAELQR
jgi:hypothetical protein